MNKNEKSYDYLIDYLVLTLMCLFGIISLIVGLILNNLSIFMIGKIVTSGAFALVLGIGLINFTKFIFKI